MSKQWDIDHFYYSADVQEVEGLEMPILSTWVLLHSSQNHWSFEMADIGNTSLGGIRDFSSLHGVRRQMVKVGRLRSRIKNLATRSEDRLGNFSNLENDLNSHSVKHNNDETGFELGKLYYDVSLISWRQKLQLYVASYCYEGMHESCPNGGGICTDPVLRFRKLIWLDERWQLSIERTAFSSAFAARKSFLSLMEVCVGVVSCLNNLKRLHTIRSKPRIDSHSHGEQT